MKRISPVKLSILVVCLAILSTGCGKLSRDCRKLQPLSTTGSTEPGWIIDEDADCAVWNPAPSGNERISYAGGCEKCMAQGPGKTIWLVNDVYHSTSEGHYGNGKLNGPCKFTGPDKTVTEGECTDNEPVGKLKISTVAPNGDKFDGYLNSDDPEDNEFTVIRTNGDVYKGGIKDADYHGTGTLKLKNGTTYVGQFQAGLIIKGIETFPSGDKYQGAFKDGLQEGYGEYWFSNGDYFVGEIKASKPDGKGFVRFAGGASFDGYFEAGMKSGYSTFIGDNGVKVEALFRNDHPVGEGYITNPGGRRNWVPNVAKYMHGVR